MRKRVLVVEQSYEQAKTIINMILSIDNDIHVIHTDSIEAAYKSAIDCVIDVFIIGVLSHGGLEALEYTYIEAIRSIGRYMFTPVILISNVEDSSYCIFRRLHCYEQLDIPVNYLYMREVLRKALCHTTERLLDKCIYLKKDNVVYPIMCKDIVYVRVNTRVLYISMKDGYVYEIPYFTIQRFLNYADYPYLMRCSRNTIINIKMIRAVDMTNRLIDMVNGDSVDIGMTYLGKIKEYLSGAV